MEVAELQGFFHYYNFIIEIIEIIIIRTFYLVEHLSG